MTQQGYGQYDQEAIMDSILKIFPPDSHYVKNEVIIKFKPQTLDLNKLCYSYSNDNISNNGKRVEGVFGLGNNLRQFLSEQTFSVEDLILDQSLIARLKLFGGDSLRRMTHANPCRDTISISRNGDTIPMAHYLYMVLKLNNDSSVVPTIVWTNLFHRNQIDYITIIGFCEDLTKTPNDHFFGDQNYLKQSYIGADFAWDFEVGDPNTLVGIFEGRTVNHNHCDLGSGGLGPNHKVVYESHAVSAFSDHATAVGGIIAAHTNREACTTFEGGVAGIAGGWGDLGVNQTEISTGASLLTYGHFVSSERFASNVLEASAKSPNSGYGQEINIANFSFRTLEARNLELHVEEALNFAHSNDVVLVSARGNTNSQTYMLPGCFAPHKNISVGSSQKNGNNLIKAGYSSFGREMDILAPAPSCDDDQSVIKTTYGGYPDPNNWGCFDGTSAAAPQVAGAVALLHNYCLKKGWTVYPEDYEGMLKASAKDIIGTDYSQYYDEKSGWGQLDLKQLFFMLESGYKLYHFEETNYQDFNIGTGYFGQITKWIILSNPTNNTNFLPAGITSAKTIPVTFEVEQPINWIPNNNPMYGEEKVQKILILVGPHYPMFLNQKKLILQAMM